MNDYEQKKQDRIDRYREKAENARAQSDALFRQSEDMASVIPFGQPVHGAADRRYRDKIEQKMDQSLAASSKAAYPNLSDADVSLIPKHIEDSGRTLTLADVQWQNADTDYTDGEALPAHYTAVATYTGTATGRSATGYNVAVEYTGEVFKTSGNTVIYTAVFSSENVSRCETHLEQPASETGKSDKTDEAEKADEAQRELSEESEQTDSAVKKIVFLILAALIALSLTGYIGWRGYRYIRDKKRGYV